MESTGKLAAVNIMNLLRRPRNDLPISRVEYNQFAPRTQREPVIEPPLRPRTQRLRVQPLHAAFDTKNLPRVHESGLSIDRPRMSWTQHFRTELLHATFNASNAPLTHDSDLHTGRLRSLQRINFGLSNYRSNSRSQHLPILTKPTCQLVERQHLRDKARGRLP